MEHLALMVLETPSFLPKLVQIALLNNDKLENWRAAWLLTKVNKQDTIYLEPYLDRIIDFIYCYYKTANQAQIRSLLRVLMDMKYNEQQDGLLLDSCSNIYISQQYGKALRVYAMNICTNIILKHSELKQEYIDSLDIMQEQEDKSLAAACRMQIKRLKRRNKRI